MGEIELQSCSFHLLSKHMNCSVENHEVDSSAKSETLSFCIKVKEVGCLSVDHKNIEAAKHSTLSTNMVMYKKNKNNKC